MYEVKPDNSSSLKSFYLIPIISKQIGTVTPTIFPESIGIIALPKHKNKIEYLVKIKARNGEITQHIILFKKEDNYWSRAIKIYRLKPSKEGGFTQETLRETTDKDFPDKNIE